MSDLLDLELEPTIAMRRGKQAVYSYAWCGLVAVQSSLAPGPLGPCPACSKEKWRRERLPIAGLRERKKKR